MILQIEKPLSNILLFLLFGLTTVSYLSLSTPELSLVSIPFSHPASLMQSEATLSSIVSKYSLGVS
jgi:hypothetical protein